MKVSANITGFRELEATLGTLKTSLAKGALRRVARKGLEPIVERAKELAPVDDGTLRDSIVIANTLSRHAARGERGETRSSVTVYAGTANRNGVPREFGTIRSAATPFLRPAFDAEKDNALRIVGAELGPEIERTAARAARRGR